MSKVFLDGKLVLSESIDPAKHRFIGEFRPATNPVQSATCDVMCNCGEILHTSRATTEHYKHGCFDVNQYVTIDPSETGIPFSSIWPEPVLS